MRNAAGETVLAVHFRCVMAISFIESAMKDRFGAANVVRQGCRILSVSGVEVRLVVVPVYDGRGVATGKLAVRWRGHSGPESFDSPARSTVGVLLDRVAASVSKATGAVSQQSMF